jgi:type I restriction enzyme R subunit
MVERRDWLNANGVTDDLFGDERRKRYLAIPEERRRAFEREEARKFFVELDRCHGSCLLREPGSAEIVSSALQFHHGTRLHCGDFVVMPNHVHWLLIPMDGYELETILQSVKRFSARQINQLLGRTGNVWQKGNFDRIVRDSDEFERTCTYIQQNPVAARLKSGAFHYYRSDW